MSRSFKKHLEQLLYQSSFSLADAKKDSDWTDFENLPENDQEDKGLQVQGKRVVVQEEIDNVSFLDGVQRIDAGSNGQDEDKGQAKFAEAFSLRQKFEVNVNHFALSSDTRI